MPAEKTMIVKRLLSLPEDYEVLGFTLSSEANVISLKVKWCGEGDSNP